MAEQRCDLGFRGENGVGAEGVEPSRPEAAGFKPAVSTVPPRARSQHSGRPGAVGSDSAVTVTAVLAVVAALGAALLYAVASVLQHRAAVAQPEGRSLRLSLLAGLARRTSWLVGVLADGAGYVAQFVALSVGALVVVQPLMVLGLLFAVPLGAWVSGERLRRSDNLAALGVCIGLALFLVAASPAAGRSSIRASTWLVLLSAGCGSAGALVLAGQRAGGPARAVLFAAASGVLYGISAALTKTTGQLFADVGLRTLLHWPPYALVVVGLAGLLVGQSAFAAGRLELSLPTMSVLDPVVSVLIGATAFHETLAGSVGAVAAEVGGLVLVVAGVYLLARSPAIRAVRDQPLTTPEPDPRPEPGPPL